MESCYYDWFPKTLCPIRIKFSAQSFTPLELLRSTLHTTPSWKHFYYHKTWQYNLKKLTKNPNLDLCTGRLSGPSARQNCNDLFYKLPCYYLVLLTRVWLPVLRRMCKKICVSSEKEGGKMLGLLRRSLHCWWPRRNFTCSHRVIVCLFNDLTVGNSMLLLWAFSAWVAH